MRRSSRSQFTFDGVFFVAAPDGLPRLAVAQDLEANQLVDVFGSQSCLIELHAKLLHSDCSDVNHSVLVPAEIAPRTEEANCSGLPPRISTRFSKTGGHRGLIRLIAPAANHRRDRNLMMFLDSSDPQWRV